MLDSSCAAGTPLFNLRLCLILLLSYGFRLALRLNTWLRDCVNLRSVFVIFDHLIGIELRSQVLLFSVAWVSVQRRDRHPAQPSLTPFRLLVSTQGVCPKT